MMISVCVWSVSSKTFIVDTGSLHKPTEFNSYVSAMLLTEK